MATDLLIVDAGRERARLLRRAQQLDLSAVFLDRDDADKFNVVVGQGDLADAGVVEAVARAHRAGGIFAASDYVTASCALAARACGLPGADPPAAARIQNKRLVREILSSHGFARPRFRVFETASDSARAGAELGLPVVVKPLLGTRGAGVSFIEHNEDIPLAFARARRVCANQPVLMEEYLSGDKVLIDVAMISGELVVFGIAERVRAEPPMLYDTAVLAPADLLPGTLAHIQDFVCKALRTIDYTNGSARVDVIVCDGAPIIIGLIGCCCGGDFQTDLAGFTCGVDALGQSMRLSMGQPLRPHATPTRAAALCYMRARTGVVTEILGESEASAMCNVEEVAVNARRGDHIGHALIEKTRARAGYVIATGATTREALNNARRSCDRCRIITDPNLEAVR